MRTKEEIMEEVRGATDYQTAALVEVLIDIRDTLGEIDTTMQRWIDIIIRR